MRLADFILSNLEPILADWEAFARSIWPEGGGGGGGGAERAAAVDPAELRDHAEEILRATAQDMATAQSSHEQDEKSKGRGDAGPGAARMVHASAEHAVGRVASGFGLAAVVAEYRALRASVVRLWRESNPQPDGHDLDDLTRFHESMDQSLAEAVRSFTERVDRSRRMFLAILGHDLRNPLSAMKLTGQLLARSGQLDPTLSDLASQLPETAVAMGQLIDDLLDYTGAELGGGLPTHPAPTDLGKLCEQVVGELRAAHPECTVHVHRQGDLTGVWDAARLRQVVSNLLGNAVQHGRGKGGGDGKAGGGGGEADCPITLTIAGDGDGGADGGVTLAVHNPGPPIPPDVLPTIFDPLTRGPEADRRHGSMGLGLYIARAVATAHGGTIGVASTAETGTTCTVRLPRRRGPKA
jgi:hypothetical protein